MAKQLEQPAPETPAITDFLHVFARYCCQKWESAAGLYPAEAIPQCLSYLQPAAVIVLAELQPLQNYPLVYTEWVEHTGADLRLRLKLFWKFHRRSDAR
jgi:hypothetical protein